MNSKRNTTLPIKEQNVGYRLASTALMLILPLAILVYLYVSKLSDELYFSRDEIIGLQHVQSINDIQQSFSPNLVSSNNSVKGKHVKNIITKLQHLEKKLLFTNLNIEEKNKNFITQLNEKFTTKSAIELQQELLSHTVEISEIVSKNLNLLIDPDQEVNKLTHLLANDLQHFPVILTDIYSGLISTLSEEHSKTSRKQLATITQKIGQLESLNSLINKHLDTVILNDADQNTVMDLKHYLDDSISKISILAMDLIEKKKTLVYLELLGESSLKTPFNDNNKRLTEEYSRLIQKTYEFSTTLNLLVVDLIEARLSDIELKRNFTLGLVFCTSVLSLLLGYYIFQNISISQTTLKNQNMKLEEAIQERVAALQESKDHNQAILDSVNDGLITIDDQGIIESLNPAAISIFGYDQAEIIGKHIHEFMPEPYRTDFEEYMIDYFESKDAELLTSIHEFAGEHKNGNKFPLEISLNEFILRDGRRFVAVIRDITERKRNEKLKDEFVSTVSHELRTPLTSIRGSLGLVIGEAVGELPPKAIEVLNIAHRNTNRLMMLINDILDLQKMDSGKLDYDFQVIDIMELLRTAIRDNKAYADEYNSIFILQEASNTNIYADPHRLMQVLSNLMSNAIKFSPRGSEIQLKLAVIESNVRVSVIDNGEGIPDEFKSRLFERFTQVDSSSSRKKGGTGLGLAITKSIVEKHGGTISFESKAGVGTTFYFDLPLPIDDLESHPKNVS